MTNDNWRNLVDRVLWANPIWLALVALCLAAACTVVLIVSVWS